MTAGVLLIHAFPLDARMWGDLRDLPGVVAPNLPGFGGSPAPSGGVTTMSLTAARCVETLDEAGLERAVVVGSSMGGYVAFELWRSAPERFAGLLLANTRAEPDAPEAAEARRALAARLRTEGNVLASSPPPLLGERADEATRARVRGWIADQSTEGIAAAALGMAERPDSRPDLPLIDVPTLIVTSSLDTLIPPEVTASIAEAIPGARLEVLDGAGHLSNVERPERFAALLREHAAGCGVALG